VDVIDLTTNTVITSIPLANSPSEIAILPNGQRAYVLTQAFQKAFVIDLATNTLLTTIPLVFTHLGSSRRQTVSTSTSPSSPVPASCWSTSPPTR